MGQHRAALRARARRQKAAFWKEMMPTIIALAQIAHVQLLGRRAALARMAKRFGEYILSRLSGPSFVEQIMPVVEVGPRRTHTWINPWEKR